MSWFWGGGGGKGDQSDPAKALDDDLKQFLKDQQPRPYRPAELSKPTAPTPTPRETPVPVASTSQPTTVEDRGLPKESLFQDGRYKDIWKTYVPQEQSGISPVERVLEARKDRRATIHKAAMENCAFEQQMQMDCMHASSWAQKIRGRATLCHEENKAYNRCYSLQAKFLQALGYMSSMSSTDDDEERIQMHADKLYHRMMDYEAEVDDARRNGKPIPPLVSLFNPNRTAPSADQLVLPEVIASKLTKPLDDYAPHERELAAKAALEEAKVADTYAKDLFNYTTTMNEERKTRQAWLTKAFGDTLGKFLIPDAPQDATHTAYNVPELEEKIWEISKSGSTEK
ncbi:hypothetical protein LTR84_003522 [Exophiala bonariae]|uniref:Uncharacterized protein n=1 Tax=Exophiala bonariae TaxID=1690606 RepID=A0AAV9N7C9_9EURO|nr:hypothetical protein LTR84_003522 [Exophiala bonariae]